MKKDKLLIICTEGAAYRDIVNSGVLEELYNKREIILVCADWMIPFLKDKFRKIQFEKVYESGKGESFIDHIRMTRAIYAPSAYPDVKTTSLKIKRDRDIKKTPFRFYSRRLIAIVSKPKFMQSILRSVSWIYRKNQIRDLFIKNNITAVFSTNMLTLDHLPYMEYAIKKGIPTATFIRSWDNLTSKGVPMYTPNKFLVWSPKETEECVKLHHISKKLVQEVGAPQFDPYFQNKIPSKEELFHRLKLPQHSRIIAYIGGIPQNVMGLTAENEKVIVDTILKGIDQGKLPNDAMVVIRPHPGVKDWKQYENFEKHKNVRINYPDWYLKGKDPPKSWNPNWDDHLFMGSLMKYSSVVVTPGGSSTLDASCFNTPSVNVYFDNPPRPYLESLRSHCDFDHLRYIREYKASPFAESPEELLQEVKDGFEKPNKYGHGRKVLVKMLVGFTDGKSAKRVAEAVLRL